VKKSEVVESDFYTDFLMNNADFSMNSANFLGIRGGRIRRISPKFSKIDVLNMFFSRQILAFVLHLPQRPRLCALDQCMVAAFFPCTTYLACGILRQLLTSPVAWCGQSFLR
jgi:hypothetical protein